MAAYPYQIVLNGVRLGTFDWIKEWSGVGIAGAASGCLAAFLASPFNLIKTRLQSASTLRDVGYQHNYASMFDAIRSIVKRDGPLGLWRGSGAAMLRTSVGSCVQLSVYDYGKSFFVYKSNLLSSMTCSVFLVAAMNPFDVVMTRLYNQNPAAIKYLGILDCFRKIVKHEGLSGLYKGALPNYLRLGPHTILTLLFYEQFKDLSLTRGFGDDQ